MCLHGTCSACRAGLDAKFVIEEICDMLHMDTISHVKIASQCL
jgi:hypothetical protein